MHPLLRGVLIGGLIQVAVVLFILACCIQFERQQVNNDRINQEIIRHAHV